MGVARCGKNQRHPNQSRQPELQKKSKHKKVSGFAWTVSRIKFLEISNENLNVCRTFGTPRIVMRNSIVLWAVIGLSAIQLQAQSDLTARIHFLGGDKISADPGFLTITNVFTSAEARVLERQTLDRMSHVPGVWLNQKLPAGAGDGSAQLRPLLDDLLKSEWIFEIRDAPNGSPEYALAIRLGTSRADFWSKNLQTLLESWTKISAQKIPGGWELKKHLPPNLIRYEQRGDWVIVDCGQNELPLSGTILAPVSSEAKDWLTVNADWPRLGQLFPGLAKLDFPKTEMRVVGRDGDLQLNGRLLLKNPLPPLDPWRVPTNSLHYPFVSFTAARGISSWLERQSWAQPYQISPVANQAFIWALPGGESPGVAYRTFIALPVPHAEEALGQLAVKLSANRNWESHLFMPFRMEITNNQIAWVNVPFITPNITTQHEKTGDFLLGALFPNSARSKPLPSELFGRLATPNLVFYHWEITAERLLELQNLCQLGLVLTHHKQLEPESAGLKWISSIGPKLGNTVTLVTEKTPTELEFTRKAPGGLTAFEFFSLATWLEATNFPGCDLNLPPPRQRLRNRQPLMTPHAAVPAPH
jgi:hypothetical protein